MIEWLLGIIAALAYLVYVFKGKADRANSSALTSEVKGQDKMLDQQQQQVKHQEVELDKQIADIEKRIKDRHE